MHQTSIMRTLLTTDTFTQWLGKLRDKQAVAKIKARMRRAELGNLGDVKAVGEGVSEMRVFVGKGYRVYFIERGIEIVVLLCGGDKSTQQKDIEKAKQIAQEVRGLL